MAVLGYILGALLFGGAAVVIWLIAEAQTYLHMQEPRPEAKPWGDVIELPREATAGRNTIGGRAEHGPAVGTQETSSIARRTEAL